jgi:hypothetical protein
MATLTDTLNERGATHGDFRENARMSQAIKRVYEASPAWAALDDVEREALELIAFKSARILTGGGHGPKHADNWRDIAGYATLAEMALGQETLPVIVPVPAAVSELSKPSLPPIQEAQLYIAPAPAAYAPFQGATVAPAEKPVVSRPVFAGGPVDPIKE